MPVIVGFDVETYGGHPITVQFYSDMQPNLTAILDVDQHSVTRVAFEHLAKRCDSGEFHVYAHNLNFDAVALLAPMQDKLREKRDRSFRLVYRHWEITGICDTQITFFMARHRRKPIVFRFIDAQSWFKGSLAQAAAVVCPDLPKLEVPELLGERRYKASDDVFAAYAMRDAQISFHQGCAINDWHLEYDVEQAWSAPGMAQRVFQKHFLDHEMWLPGDFDTRRACMAAYHGGKNNLVPHARGRWFHHVDAWDISSAYPHAMTDLPAFSKKNLYRDGEVFGKDTRQVPPHGVYCVSGRAARCHWPVFLRYDPKAGVSGKLVGVRGDVADLWVTGYELNEALASGEFKPTSIYGHLYDSERDPRTETALQRYVGHFYEKKQTTDSTLSRSLYKLLLNSLYGKFWEMNDREEADGTMTKNAGRLWHPLVASLTTGHTRTQIHKLEHHVKALHTSTDGVLCTAGNSPTSFPFAPAEGLGAIEAEGRDLVVALVKNKLYLAYTREPNKHPSQHFEGLYFAKDIRHAFQGTRETFENCIATGRWRYSYLRRVTLRAAREGETVNDFIVDHKTIKDAPEILKGRPPQRKQRNGNRKTQNDSSSSSSSSSTGNSRGHGPDRKR